MTEEIMGWLAGLQQLKFHGLSDSRVRHYGHPHNWEFLSHIITRCHDIRYLELDGSTHTHVFLSSILKLPSVPKLEKLIIRGLASQNDVLGLKTEVRRSDMRAEPKTLFEIGKEHCAAKKLHSNIELLPSRI